MWIDSLGEEGVLLKLKEINILNVLMCASVVIIHLTAGLVLELNHDSIWYMIFFTINKFFTFAVPAFLFLSGFKLFHKYKESQIDYKMFLIGRVKKVIVPYLICYAVYFFFYLSQNLATWDEFWPGLLLGKLVAHFYYIIIAIQFYLIFPLLLWLFNKNDKLLLLLSFICTIAFNQFLTFEYSDRFFGTYLLYFVLGMFIAKRNNSEIKNRSIYILSGMLVVISVIHLYLSYLMSIEELWYRNSPIWQVVYSTLAILTLYCVCKKINDNKLDKIINFINPRTFNIFLYHILIINILQFVVYPNYNLGIKAQFIITTCVVMACFLLYCFRFGDVH